MKLTVVEGSELQVQVSLRLHCILASISILIVMVIFCRLFLPKCKILVQGYFLHEETEYRFYVGV